MEVLAHVPKGKKIKNVLCLKEKNTCANEITSGKNYTVLLDVS